jgi:hypothetical protein
MHTVGPKSGEAQLQTAPKLFTASLASKHSTEFGMYPTTISFRFTPACLSASWYNLTRRLRSLNVIDLIFLKASPVIEKKIQ